MECKKDRCALTEIHPNTTVSIACDCECYFKGRKDAATKTYLKRYPKIMKACGF